MLDAKEISCLLLCFSYFFVTFEEVQWVNLNISISSVSCSSWNLLQAVQGEESSALWHNGWSLFVVFVLCLILVYFLLNVCLKTVVFILGKGWNWHFLIPFLKKGLISFLVKYRLFIECVFTWIFFWLILSVFHWMLSRCQVVFAKSTVFYCPFPVFPD